MWLPQLNSWFDPPQQPKRQAPKRQHNESHWNSLDLPDNSFFSLHFQIPVERLRSVSVHSYLDGTIDLDSRALTVTKVCEGYHSTAIGVITNGDPKEVAAKWLAQRQVILIISQSNIQVMWRGSRGHIRSSVPIICKTGKGIIVTYTQNVLIDFQRFITCKPPELGGFLFGTRDLKNLSIEVAHFAFDGDGTTNSVSYRPSARRNEIINNTIKRTGLAFLGVIHSHPGDYDHPSPPDEEAMEEIMLVNREVPCVLAPIITKRPCRGSHEIQLAPKHKLGNFIKFPRTSYVETRVADTGYSHLNHYQPAHYHPAPSVGSSQKDEVIDAFARLVNHPNLARGQVNVEGTPMELMLLRDGPLQFGIVVHDTLVIHPPKLTCKNGNDHVDFPPLSWDTNQKDLRVRFTQAFNEMFLAGHGKTFSILYVNPLAGQYSDHPHYAKTPGFRPFLIKGDPKTINLPARLHEHVVQGYPNVPSQPHHSLPGNQPNHVINPQYPQGYPPSLSPQPQIGQPQHANPEPHPRSSSANPPNGYPPGYPPGSQPPPPAYPGPNVAAVHHGLHQSQERPQRDFHNPSNPPMMAQSGPQHPSNSPMMAHPGPQNQTPAYPPNPTPTPTYPPNQTPNSGAPPMAHSGPQQNAPWHGTPQQNSLFPQGPFNQQEVQFNPPQTQQGGPLNPQGQYPPQAQQGGQFNQQQGQFSPSQAQQQAQFNAPQGQQGGQFNQQQAQYPPQGQQGGQFNQQQASFNPFLNVQQQQGQGGSSQQYVQGQGGQTQGQAQGFAGQVQGPGGQVQGRFAGPIPGQANTDPGLQYNDYDLLHH